MGVSVNVSVEEEVEEELYVCVCVCLLVTFACTSCEPITGLHYKERERNSIRVCCPIEMKFLEQLQTIVYIICTNMYVTKGAL